MMIASSAAPETAAAGTSGIPTGAKPPGPFAKPGPGSWVLDASHCERPMPKIAERCMERGFHEGFREALQEYGALLERVELAEINGFLYQCFRPVGAPPEPKGLPPKAIFKLLLLLHPEIRRRLRRAEKVWEEKPWRQETRRYLEETAPATDREIRRLLDRNLASLDDAALAGHVAESRRLLDEDLYQHFRINMARCLPVGDFLAQAMRWTGATANQALDALRGSSPHSREGLAELEKLAGLLRADPARERLETESPERLIAELESRRDAVGDAARAWLGQVGHQCTGFSPGYPTLREMPATLAAGLRQALRAAFSAPADPLAADATEGLRARVPEDKRADFDALLAEARAVYFLRDHSCLRATACCGVLRSAALEAGRRLAAKGLAPEAEAGLDATVAELRSLLTEGKGPSSATLAERLAWRRGATPDLAPDVIGPAPGQPPPADWLPGGAARMARAMDVYVQCMFGERAEKNRRGPVIEGLAAGGGKRRGRARHVLETGDFDKVEPGDVLVARITTPTYNILLPLLAGIVTDRGGILSHPAIVSREYGIPGVVGTRNATALIPDGAEVEIDGDAGTVRVLG